MKFLLFSLLFCNTLYAEDSARDSFNQLRARHTGKVAAVSFSAEMDEKTAKALLKNLTDPPYRVDIEYHTETGVRLLVRDTEPFYEQALESQAKYINAMLLPLLSSSGYLRLQKAFEISIPKEKSYQVNYKRGDIDTQYLFQEGELGLIDHITYYENDKKNFLLEITWKKIEEFYVPFKIKSTSYESSKQAVSFQIQNIQLKE